MAPLGFVDVPIAAISSAASDIGRLPIRTELARMSGENVSNDGIVLPPHVISRGSLGQSPGPTQSRIEEVIESAHAAFEAARSATAQQRAGWLRAVAKALERATDELVVIAASETNLPVKRLGNELLRTRFQLGLLADETALGGDLDATIDHPDPDWPMGPRPDLRRMNIPLGVVGVFGASNFPFAFSVAGGDSGAALAAGCAVVHKVHPAHEQLGLLTAQIVVDALASAGAPDGLFSAVFGRETGITLVEHPLTAAVGFTGSTAVGRALFDRVAVRPTPIPFYGELGSINPVFVTRGAWAARRKAILEEFAASFTLGMGQFCTKPGLMFVPEDATAEELAAVIEGKAGTRMLSPDIRDGFLSAFDRNRSEPGVAVIGRSGAADPSPMILLTDTAALARSPSLLETEMFGPASMVIRYRDSNELLHWAKAIAGQLTAAVHAVPEEDIAPLLTVLRERAGRILWNAWPTGVTVSYAQQHGGPYPASTAPSSTSVGPAAARRFMRPLAYQSFPDLHLPPPLRDSNPWNIVRRVDGQWVEPSTE